MIKEYMILFGHEDPNQIHPQPFLLTLEYQKLVADKLRATIKCLYIKSL
ncbi:hypothetical protein HanXRQr2_Chr12g0525571 [Helianthus annuus]|uniref:Uncharacterized protein n=1 Tax=Helianthus annuus TaxID=4232 RepID=A0A9K3EPQ3_HELAN|nr:hypothetical protein HanXRQr2_Chr12g0525571 [Helianthus annuus]KAJ0861412.1 hypothetical protein HanPSC8_Chr12g0506351 [Helianthus annuus]